MKALYYHPRGRISQEIAGELSKMLFVCFTVDNSDSAIQALEASTRINLVVADQEVGLENIIDLIIHLRNSELHSMTPVIVMAENQTHPGLVRLNDFEEVFMYYPGTTLHSYRQVLKNAMRATDRKILVVDDEPMVRDILRVTLEREGFAVIEAADGPEALEAARKYDPAMVITDINMPEMSGRELLERLKMEKPALPVFLISGSSGDMSNEELAALGADGIIAKPFKYGDIIKMVRKGLDHIIVSDRSD